MSSISPTVLVVDDEEALLDLIEFVLMDAGYAVERAANGQQALDLVAERLPDLVLLDMKMPVMDGWEFAQEFHARYDHEVPIVVVSAAADARQYAAEVGALGWIGKPFEIEELIGTVRRLIHKA